jgi:putative peptide maturation dehydrogenase
MERIKRARHLFVRVTDVPHLHIARLTEGELEVSMRSEALASTPAVPGEQPLTLEEFRVLTAVSSESWQSAAEVAAELAVDGAVLSELVSRGLLLCDGDDPQSLLCREREARYCASFWDPFAASYHYNAGWRDHIGDQGRQTERLRGYAEPPPEPFYDHPAATRRVELPEVAEQRPFLDLLRARRTTRSFDTGEPLPLSELSAVLFHTYGCQGVSDGGLYPALRKTSPSGGAMHPVEVYPLVRDVENLAPGWYHYNLRHHRIDLVREMDREEVERLALLFVAGQEYFVSAHVLCVLAVRFYRHNWKYRHHSKAYRVVLMDAAHLSQTFFLVCAERGLGAFFTAAINERNIEDELGLDPLEQGVVGINGCGIRKDPDRLALVIRPFVPAGGC